MNHQLKTFPDLMKGKKIMYVHGFASAASSGTVKRMRVIFPNTNIISYDLPIHPQEAMDLLKKVCEEEKPDLIIGTSMGGMYTEQLYGFDRICVNPAFQMGETMREHNMMGKQVFQNPREDGVQEFIVTKALVKEYQEITEQNFSNVTPDEQQRVFGLFGDRDEIVNTFGLFSTHYPQALHFHGEHRMDDSSFLHGVVPVIRWIDDRQEKRERPIVYVAIEAMVDSWGKPVSCLNKAFDLLIEHYSVYVVAAAPTNDPAYLTQTQAWVEKFISTPAYNRVVFTNQRGFLYGDYFIDPHPDKGFMGAQIAFGSDEFKTWEEIISYFERLGGQ